MPTFNSDTVAKVLGEAVGAAGTADNASDRITRPYQNGGVVRVAKGKRTCAADQIADIIRFAWVPKGATIIGGLMANAALGASTTIKLGILGVSGTAFDNDDDVFLAATATSAAAVTAFPGATAGAGGPAGSEYTVTDPQGAYIIGVIGGGAATGLVTAQAYWSMD